MPCDTCSILAKTASQTSGPSAGTLIALGLAVAIPVGLIVVAAAKK